MKKNKYQLEEWNQFPITKEDILRSFDNWTFTKGNEYFYQNMVKSITLGDRRVEGKVSGSSKSAYDVKLRKDGENLRGVCSCPVGFDCKHCVAVALQWASIPIKQDHRPAKKPLVDQNSDDELNVDNEEFNENKDLDETRKNINNLEFLIETVREELFDNNSESNRKWLDELRQTRKGLTNKKEEMERKLD